MDEKYKFIKKNGIFYTDKQLAEKMIYLLDINYLERFTLIEPAVGEGHILSIIVERYLSFNKDREKNELINFLENNIVAFDIREDAIEKCIEKLDNICKCYIHDIKINWNIKKFDALNRYSLINKFGTFDFVISNPPYVSRHNMDERTIHALKNESIFCSKYNFDLYYYFFEIGLDLWNRKGKMVYITPNSYIKARSGEAMMKEFVDNSLIETIIDYKDKMLFEGANTYTAITVFSKGNTNLKVQNDENNTMINLTYKDLIEKNKYKIYSHDFLMINIEGYISLGNIAEIRNGLATLQDKVFVINKNEIIEENDRFLIFEKNGEVFTSEIDGVKKVIRASNSEEKNYVIFPYSLSNKSKTLYIQNGNIANQYPEIYKYLLSQLSQEYQKKYGIFFGRTQGFTCYNDKKIIIPKVASLENEAFKIVSKGFLLSGLSIRLNEDYLETDLEQLLSYLNSEVVRNYLTITSKNYAAGYKSISSTDLKLIQIPRSIVTNLQGRLL
ncbi:Eco57I restriction-modification methylase domain-containing protein [Enterococcus faecalis]